MAIGTDDWDYHDSGDGSPVVAIMTIALVVAAVAIAATVRACISS